MVGVLHYIYCQTNSQLVQEYRKTPGNSQSYPGHGAEVKDEDGEEEGTLIVHIVLCTVEVRLYCLLD